MPVFEDYHRTVIGYHGTRLSTARKVVVGNTSLRTSENGDDWLGHGVYFWEYAPQQAWDWAKRRYGKESDVAVLGAMIRLGNCLDLLEPANAKKMKGYFRNFERDAKAVGRKIPKNYNARKPLDCAVFEYTAQAFGDASDPIDTVRGVYVPIETKSRLWPRSWSSPGMVDRLSCLAC